MHKLCAGITSGTATITPSWPANQNPPEDIDTFRLADNSGDRRPDDTVLPGYGWRAASVGRWSLVEQRHRQHAARSGKTRRPGTPPEASLSTHYAEPDRSTRWESSATFFATCPGVRLDLSTAGSADAGMLLDFFCVNDGYAGSTNAPVVRRSPRPEHLRIRRCSRRCLTAPIAHRALSRQFQLLIPSATMSRPSDATNMANAITNITANLPLLNKSELATRVAPADPTVLANATAEPGIDTNIKERREAIVRALASTGQVRTWNLMIDVIAQTGHFPPNATGFNNFIVTAEQRYWAHVAIDRYTDRWDQHTV